MYMLQKKIYLIDKGKFMKKLDIKRFIYDVFYLTLGCVITAFSVNYILKPNGLFTSGITGIAIILEHYININYSIIYYLFTILILVVTMILLGKREILKIAFISILYPTVLLIMQKYEFKFIEDDLLLATIYFSVFFGIGVGMILRKGYSFGGTDTIAKILSKRVLKTVSISYIMLTLDGIIIIASAFVFGRNIALYSIISQVITTKVYDYIMFGLGTKLYRVEIISDKNKDIVDYIMYDIKRGVTLINIIGSYTNEEKVKLVTVCSPRESILIRDFIKEIDTKAYVEVLPIVSVWGRGNRFININADQ